MSGRDLIDELLQARVKTQLFGGDHAPRLGRLVILGALGSGGMGTVLSAYDPRLDRKVAVKLLRSGGPGTASRLLREARALGKLTHPNVVAVHDATETEGIVSIVMELAPGESLRHFIGKGKPWWEVLDVMQQVAAGLAAAHRAGIIHRDIKPDNVMIGPDRVRLVDFGLAHAPPAVQAAADAHASSTDTLEGSGTPSYMAPEVLRGAPASEASDQYSFGVTLYEALWGKRPERVGDAVPSTSSVPSWLREIVTRTLAVDPEGRFPSMAALLAELERDRRLKRTGIAVALAALALAISVGAFGYYRGARRDVCTGGRERVTAAWPSGGLEGLRARFGAAPWAEKAVNDLVELGGAWVESHRRVCEATRVRGSQPESVLEVRMRCLDRRLDRMTALASALGGSLDAEARENASAAIAVLPRPERCESLTEAGELALPEDADRRSRVERANQDMDRAQVAYSLGRYREAREIGSVIEAETSDIDFPALRASLLLLLGSIEARLGEGGRARTRLEAALREAAAARSGHVELEIWARLLRNELFDGKPAQVIEWAPFARASAARVDQSGAEIDGIVAEARREAGDLGAARELLKRALASRDPLRGDQRALLEMNLGSVELAAGKPDAAEAAFERALGLAEAALGRGHPGLGLYQDKLAASARARGKMRDALARHERALELRRLVYGDSDRAVATALLHRAQTRIEAGRLRDAERDLVLARKIRAQVHGPTHRRLGEIDLELGNVAAARGDEARAAELYGRAALLDHHLDVRPRLAALGVRVEAMAPRAEAELSVDGAEAASQHIARLLAQRDSARAEAESKRLLSRFRAAGDGAAASLANPVAVALQRLGQREEAAKLFEGAVRSLADEPSRERLRALAGLAQCADGARGAEAAKAALRALDAMPELDAPERAALERAAR